MQACLTAQSRAAVSATNSNIFRKSEADLLITLSTLLVAVWYSSDSSRSPVRSRSSLRSRVFSMAMTAWAAKFEISSICLSVNGFTSAINVDGTDNLVLLEHWYGNLASSAA
jgi:hypothetical protein